MVSRNSRPYKLGHSLGENLCEVANILYLLDNGEQFLTGIKEVIEPKIKEIKDLRRKKQSKEHSIKKA